jgi:hypothetical protein
MMPAVPCFRESSLLFSQICKPHNPATPVTGSSSTAVQMHVVLLSGWLFLEEQAALAALLKRKNAKKILTCKGRGKKTAKNSLEPVAETDAKTHNHEQKKKTRRK